MINVTSFIVQQLVNDPELETAQYGSVAPNNIFVGPEDIVVEAQGTPANTQQLVMPQINIRVISEQSRTVPLAVRDIRMQTDIWSNQNQLQVDTIYERVVSILNLIIANNNGTHIFWMKLDACVDMYDDSVRLWHKSFDFRFWVL